ncbi:hypothetical protein AWRI1631_131220 [Saccharomyces cerevisiae AWRI1631]|uniref:Uncharacterized protein n=1 Tax=Saccharomyces cerevisiae (strain AWRI1631) TaxID=545124 RepID=B5VPB1_YEAS6|nr:hypothetical protein AWRI1631_131220 [Saccharomyces cerevisiae AWRI1631]
MLVLNLLFLGSSRPHLCSVHYRIFSLIPISSTEKLKEIEKSRRGI